MTEYQDRYADYVDVAERVRLFRDKHPEGSLQPLNLAEPFTVATIDGQTFVVYTAAAYRYPDDPRPGVGIAWEPIPGKTPYTRDSELMNAETAAWGRAILAALAADSKRVATMEEVRNRTGQQNPARRGQTAPEGRETPGGATDDPPATEAQERALYAISKKLDRLPPAKGSLTKKQAGQAIEQLQALLEAQTSQEEPF